MTVEEVALLRRMRDTLNPHDIWVRARDGRYILSFVDSSVGLISYACNSIVTAYKLGLDMRDRPKAYVEAERMRTASVSTPFFTEHSNLLQAE